VLVLAVEKWAKGKPVLIALLAPWVASSCQDLPQGFEQLKEWRFMNEKLPPVDLSVWADLYRSHATTFDVLKIIFATAWGERITNIGFYIFRVMTTSEGFKKKHLSSPTPRQLTFFQNLLRRILLRSFTLLSRVFSGKAVTPSASAKDRIRHLVNHDVRFAFFLKVSTPSWIFYGMSPTQLYRQAYRGNVNAIDKLLRLDSLMAGDPPIRSQISSLHFGHKLVDYESLLKAPLRSPGVHITPLTTKSAKIAGAGLISILSSRLGHPLTAPQIRDLFNKITEDSAPTDLKLESKEDPDLTGYTEAAFTKAIQRSRKNWLEMLYPDNKSFQSVQVT
jgi:hypothetical protein